MNVFMGRIVGRKVGADGRRHDYDDSLSCAQRIEVNNDPKITNCLTTVQKDNIVMIERIDSHEHYDQEPP